MDNNPNYQSLWPRRYVLTLLFGLAVALIAVVFTRGLLHSSRVHLPSPQALLAYFQSIGYTSNRLREGNALVPRLVVSDISADWAAGLKVDPKKSLFFLARLLKGSHG